MASRIAVLGHSVCVRGLVDSGLFETGGNWQGGLWGLFAYLAGAEYSVSFINTGSMDGGRDLARGGMDNRYSQKRTFPMRTHV